MNCCLNQISITKIMEFAHFPWIYLKNRLFYPMHIVTLDISLLIISCITLFRHRVMAASFWKLFDLIKPNLMPHMNKQKRGCTPNGDISVSAHLSMTLRWFAGGEAIDSHNANPWWSWIQC